MKRIVGEGVTSTENENGDTEMEVLHVKENIEFPLRGITLESLKDGDLHTIEKIISSIDRQGNAEYTGEDWIEILVEKREVVNCHCS